MKIVQLVESASLEFWHGSPSGEFKHQHFGIHVGSKEAARQALCARIGTKADGTDWDGTQEYGQTLLAGKRTLMVMDPRGHLCTGYGAGSRGAPLPDEDFLPADWSLKASYSDGSRVPLTVKPNLFRVQIVGPMFGTPQRPLDDVANTRMRKAMLKGSPPPHGFYYTNRGEDEGSLAAVVPSGEFLRVL